MFNNIFNIGTKAKLKKVRKKDIIQKQQDKMIDILSVREERTNQMFNSISRYTAIRDELIKQSILKTNKISKEEANLILKDFVENTANQLPKGVIVPIKTNFVYRGKSQTLFIGKDILIVSKSIINNVDKPRHNIYEKSTIGFFLESEQVPEILNQNVNVKVSLSSQERMKLINIAEEALIDSKTEFCRIGNLNIEFENWEESFDCIITPKDNEIFEELIDYMISLDYDTTKGITNYFDLQAAELEKKQEEINSTTVDTDTIETDNRSSVSTESSTANKHINHNAKAEGSDE